MAVQHCQLCTFIWQTFLSVKTRRRMILWEFMNLISLFNEWAWVWHWLCISTASQKSTLTIYVWCTSLLFSLIVNHFNAHLQKFCYLAELVVNVSMYVFWREFISAIKRNIDRVQVKKLAWYKANSVKIYKYYDWEIVWDQTMSRMNSSSHLRQFHIIDIAMANNRWIAV